MNVIPRSHVTARPADRKAANSYSLADAMRHTGAKRSQVEHWVRSQIVTPEKVSTGTGDHREFSMKNLVEIAVAAELVDCDVTVSKMPMIFQLTIRKNWPKLRDPKQREDVAVLSLWYVSRFATGKPKDGPAGAGTLGGLPRLMSVKAVQAKLEQGDTMRALINVKRIIEALERATGDRVA